MCAPLRVERRALGRHVGRAAVARSGPGPARSGATARRLAAAGPRPVLVAGVAGGLDAALAPGDLVVADEVRAEGRAPVPVPSATALAAALRALGLTVHVGPVHSARRPVVGARRRALAAQGALAVDTESAWLAAGAAGGPFAVVRAVVDTPAAPLVHPGTVRRGVAALRVLRRSVPALATWVAACGAREVLLAEPRSFCAGVDRAIATVERALERHGPPVYVRRQIVHNGHVVADLERRGAVFVREVDEVPPGSVVVLAAHGVAPAVRAAASARRLAVVDATCPLVAKVHAGVRRQAERDATVFLIGHADHEEVEGTLGEAPERVVVVGSVAEAEAVSAPDPHRVASAVQTTLALDEAESIAAVLRRRFPALVEPRSADICYATTNRQAAVRAVAAEADRLVVVGSPNSSNSVRLVEVAARAGADARRVDHADELDLAWLAGAPRVAVTAGASAPDRLVDGVVDLLRGLGPVTVTPRSATTEDVRFTLPKEVS
ncbi:4-hydroxy-3-methylbut-2-enyl diphosphate reductase [Actinomycetospora cinnamomea]|uniref:4-hydroxy-3-methylbut-2-enyl diphosphate reductase n=1 Tax=Actinomycetospora cinnamomea TaxID=663609 RepID=A0A2U1F8X4_9PSEU|nr:4-hydroxy-3-methylbut-2-enyl diphosphate reductase [Actinomycetospora cinnamomea]